MKKAEEKNDYFCSNTVNLEAADSNHSADTARNLTSSRTIDELLRWAANESTAEIDFESIRLRAVESSRKSKMQRIRRIRALTAAGAAILFDPCLFLHSPSEKSTIAQKDLQVSAGLTPNAGGNTRTVFSDPMNLPSGYDSFQNAGTVADEAIKNTNMFPQKSSSSEMHKKVDNDSRAFLPKVLMQTATAFITIARLLMLRRISSLSARSVRFPTAWILFTIGR